VSGRCVVVATITVHADAADDFRQFERQAAAIMERHGGRIERTVVAEGSPGELTEVHVVAFPGTDAFAAYRSDPALAELAQLREASVISTTVVVGTDGPNYHAVDVR
jgi:uncharacterized protein (DUF1330 family)